MFQQLTHPVQNCWLMVQLGVRKTAWRLVSFVKLPFGFPFLKRTDWYSILDRPWRHRNLWDHLVGISWGLRLDYDWQDPTWSVRFQGESWIHLANMSNPKKSIQYFFCRIFVLLPRSLKPGLLGVWFSTGSSKGISSLGTAPSQPLESEHVDFKNVNVGWFNPH